MSSSKICDFNLVKRFLCFIINFTTSLIDDRYTHQCSDKIVMFGPAATLLAGRMIGLGSHQET